MSDRPICRYCGRPEATDADWDRHPGHFDDCPDDHWCQALCWDEADCYEYANAHTPPEGWPERCRRLEAERDAARRMAGEQWRRALKAEEDAQLWRGIGEATDSARASAVDALIAIHDAVAPGEEYPRSPWYDWRPWARQIKQKVARYAGRLWQRALRAEADLEDIRQRLRGLPDSVLTGDGGLAAATYRDAQLAEVLRSNIERGVLGCGEE